MDTLHFNNYTNSRQKKKMQGKIRIANSDHAFLCYPILYYYGEGRLM